VKWILALVVVALACGDDDVAPLDSGPDAGALADAGTSEEDAGADATVPVDAWRRETPPTCEPLPAVDPPACGSGPVDREALLAGGDALAEKARRFDRVFHAIAAVHTGVNSEVVVPDADDRAAIEAFVTDEDGWDLEASTGTPVEDMVRWTKVAGAYGGAGAAADAFRYAVLRDEGAACEEVERARAHLVAAMDGLHRAVAITGTPGVIARGYIRRDFGEFPYETVPLFDEEGNPLPEEKTNGTWRDDVSGDYPEYAWEDSCSRDMLIGWVLGMAAAWEVVANDDAIDDALKTRLRDDALAIGEQLRVVRDSGYDLEVPDADGRTTYHGYLHENAIDRTYADILDNGQHAMMALGIVAALVRITGDEELADYLHNDLVRARGLPEIVRDHAGDIDFGVITNFSNYNMSFTGSWLASRYLCDEDARATVNEAIALELYETPGDDRQPAEMGQSFFDVVYVAASAGAHASGRLGEFDADALERGVDTLRRFPDPPFWNVEAINCDEDELEAMRCTLVDGETEVELEESLGRGDHPVATTPLPIELRPPSNYNWRSDPYRVNGGGAGNVLLPGVDFRLAYWMARYLR